MNMPAAAIHGDEAAAEPATYIHATALAVAETGILIRGPSGAGKSRLALQLIAESGRRGCFARLVGDDRIAVAARGGRLIARPHPAIAGQIESRGEGILATPHEAAALIRLVIDIGAKPAAAKPVAAPARMPEAHAKVCLCGVELPLLSLDGPGSSQAGIVMDYLLRMGNG
jgi:serine kinase of HPr protein (carbohydrate metabolism regulator)